MGHTGTDTQDGLNAAVFLFVKILLLFFYWSIIALQYCISFYCTMKWISCVCVCVCVCVCTQLLSHVWLSATPWTVALQPPLEPVAISCSRGSSWSRDWTHVSSGEESAIRIHASLPSWASQPPTSLGHLRAPSWASCVYSSFPLAIGFTHGSIQICQP